MSALNMASFGCTPIARAASSAASASSQRPRRPTLVMYSQQLKTSSSWCEPPRRSPGVRVPSAHGLWGGHALLSPLEATETLPRGTRCS
jgi:hypothetical protein